jgi:hypothetical protein
MPNNETAMSLLDDFLGEEVRVETLSLFEMSSMATVGSVGFGTPFPGKPRSKKKKRKLRKVSSPYSLANESIINEVYQLIMSRGLSK